ncbi:MAG: amidase [Steroidobacteraceae bacterium]
MLAAKRAAAKTAYGEHRLTSAPVPSVADAFVVRFVVEPEADGPLRGTSFAVKDVFDVAGWPTGCGNPTWRATHSSAKINATVVQLLLRAGARLIGKTRTDELAYSLEGRNFHEGAPINSAAPERLTGGSSSGAASAVAAGETAFAVASDTAGSVRVPAAWCGLVGMRPTHDRVPVAGLTPLAPSFDTVGWLGRSTSLMRTIGAVLFGDRTMTVPAFSLVRDRSVEIHAEAVGSAALELVFERCARQVLQASELSLGIDLSAAAECLRVLQGHEVWRTHGRWIDSAKPSFGPEIAERFAAARAITADQVSEAAQERAAITARLDAALPPGRILCLPTVPGSAPRRDASLEHLLLRRAQLLPLTALASLTGRPQITLPLLLADGAPVGVSLLGWRHGDEALLEIAELLSPS